MSKSDGTFILVATYPDERAAREDYQVVKEAHAHGLVGSYDAALVTKDMNGKIHENKDETGTRHGTWWGIAAGAVVGVLFPPSIIGAAALGGVIGGGRSLPSHHESPAPGDDRRRLGRPSGGRRAGRR